MRNIRTFLWISVLFFLIPQGSYAAAKQTTLICKLTDCPVDSLSLFNFTGLTYKRSYVAKKDKSASGVMSQAGAKGMQMVLLRDLTGEEFAEAMISGFKKNASDAEITKYQSRLDELLALMKTFGKVPKGTTIHMNLVPGSGMRVLVGGVQKGRDIAGDDFYNTLLKIWLGSSPVDSDLKQALLGG